MVILVRFSAIDLEVVIRKQVDLVPSLLRMFETLLMVAPCAERSVVISFLARSAGRCLITYLIEREAQVV